MKTTILLILWSNHLLWVHGEAVLTSTHNLCFESKIRKVGISLQTLVLLYASGGMRGYRFHGLVFLILYCKKWSFVTKWLACQILIQDVVSLCLL